MAHGKKLFAQLRFAMKVRRTNQRELARALHTCNTTLSKRFYGKREWPLSDMYAAMDFLGIPYSQMHLYFPRDGFGLADASIIDEIYSDDKTSL